MRISVETDVRDLRRWVADFDKKIVPAAAGIALNRVKTTVVAQTSKTIRQRLVLSASATKKAIRARRIGMGFTLMIEARGDPIPLKEYQARSTRKGVTFKVSRQRSRRLYQAKGRPGFIINSKGGHVFVRTEAEPPGKQRARIRKVYGPSIPQYFVTSVVRDVMLTTAKERWPIEVARAVRGVLLRRTGIDVGSDLSGLFE